MNASTILHPVLYGFVKAGATREEVAQAFREWEDGSGTAAPTEENIVALAGAFYGMFPGLEPSDNPEKFFTDALTAANGNLETATAVLEIQRQNQERGQWRDETFPAGLVFWTLKNKEHDKLRRQGYAIRMQRKEEPTQGDEAAPAAPSTPKPAPVETAAFTPSNAGVSRLQAALGNLPKRG